MGVCYWPSDVPREISVDAFDQMLRQQGFAPCANRTVEIGLEKVVLYTLAGTPTHLARQLSKGKWSSKLGQAEDIEHTNNALEGPEYGTIHQVYSRPQLK